MQLTNLTPLVSGLTLLLATASSAIGRPNVLFIMSDDHAAHAIGAYRGRLAELDPTPNIDRLAAEGMLFEQAFATNSICTPSRATLLTGQYSHVNGVRTLNGALPPSRQALANQMRRAGYETAMVGKWHLKNEPAFDYYAVLPGQGSYFNPILRVSGGVWPDHVERFSGYDSSHSSDVVTDLSLDWLKNRESDKPFFLMHHFKAPHDNFENAERYDFLYKDIDIPEPDSLWATPNHGSKATEGMGTSIGKRNQRRNMGHHMFVDESLGAEQYKRTAYQRYLKKYLRTVRGVDDNIGRLLEFLVESGDLDNTVIVYTSDQGFMLGEHDYIDKRWMYEESMRIPLLVRYPPFVQAGERTRALAANVDFAPTILDIAGGDIPDEMQGRSLVSILKGETPADWRKSVYYRYWMHMAHHDNPAHYGIRTERYKLIFFYGLPLDAEGAVDRTTEPGWELYDLKEDPHERRNVYAAPEYAPVARRLKSDLLEQKNILGDTDDRYPDLMRIRRQHWE